MEQDINKQIEEFLNADEEVQKIILLNLEKK